MKFRKFLHIINCKRQCFLHFSQSFIQIFQRRIKSENFQERAAPKLMTEQGLCQKINLLTNIRSIFELNYKLQEYSGRKKPVWNETAILFAPIFEENGIFMLGVVFYSVNFHRWK